MDSFFNMYTCDLCLKNFTTKGNLKRHSLLHKSDQDSTKFTCDLCSRRFTRKEHVKKHLSCPGFDCVGQKKFSKKHYLTRESTKKCKQQESLEIHTSIARTHYNTRSSSRKMLGLTKDSFKCDLCEEIFIREAELREHKSTHDPEPDSKFTETNFDSSQRKFGELGDKPTQGCDPDMKNSFLLKKVELTRKNDISHLDRLNTCSICQRSFIEIEVLKNHLLTHV